MRREPLYYAKEKENVIKLLLKKEYKANVNYLDGSGTSIIHHAVKIKDNLDLIELLLDNEATMNCIDKRGMTLLDYAKIGNNEEIIKLLLNNETNNTILTSENEDLSSNNLNRLKDKLNSLLPSH